jgi:hypothetical protein
VFLGMTDSGCHVISSVGKGAESMSIAGVCSLAPIVMTVHSIDHIKFMAPVRCTHHGISALWRVTETVVKGDTD